MGSTLSRRCSLLGLACCAPMAASLALGAGALTPAHAAGKTTDLTADQALQRLKDGNRKFMADAPDQTAAAAQMDNPRLNHECLNHSTPSGDGPRPDAVCGPGLLLRLWRAPPELLFGRGLGELFIVRNAGNTVDTVALGTLEYAVAQLGVPLVLVLGHERCGAVDAALVVGGKECHLPRQHRPDDRADHPSRLAGEKRCAGEC